MRKADKKNVINKMGMASGGCNRTEEGSHIGVRRCLHAAVHENVQQFHWVMGFLNGNAEHRERQFFFGANAHRVFVSPMVNFAWLK